MVHGAIGKELAKGRDFAAIEHELSSRCKMITGKTSDAVSKAIDMNDGRFAHAPVASLRFQRFKLHQVIDHDTEILERDYTGKRCRCRRKDVATVESSADRMAKELLVG